MSGSFEKIQAVKLSGTPEDRKYLSNAGRKGARESNRTKQYNKALQEVRDEDQKSEMEELAKERRDDLLDE